MSDPKSSDGIIAMSQREAAVGLGMRKERWIEIESKAAALCPVDPGGKMLRLQLVALDLSAGVIGVDRVQVEAMLAGNQTECLVEVGTKFVDDACLTRIITRRLNAPAGQSCSAFKAADV